MYIAYLRGFEGKDRGAYGLGLNSKEYKKGVSDRLANLPNRYLLKNARSLKKSDL